MALSTITRTPEQLDGILRAGSGSLVDTPYATLLLALARAERSAMLTLHRHPLQKVIVFESGSPVDCQSNIATETLGRFLVSIGRLSEEECRAAVAEATSRGVTLEEILTARKLIEPAELHRVSQQSLGRKLLEPFSWKSGTFELAFEVPPAESALRVKVPQLVLTGILKVETQESVDDAVAFANDLFLVPASDPLFDLEDLRLSSEQQKLVDAARQGARVRDLGAKTSIDEDDVRRIVYALLLLGVFTVAETLTPPARSEPHFELENPFFKLTLERPLPPLPVATQAAAPPAPAAAVPTTAASREEVLTAYHAYRSKDAFDLLGVSDTDGPLQFIRAFLSIADRFLPSKFDDRAPDALRQKAQDVFLAAARAYADLADPMRREALRAARGGRTAPEPKPETTLIVPIPVAPETPAPRPPERPPMKAAIIDPELLCRSGRELAEAGKLREALSSFELAAECDAQNGTYAAEVAWCRFRLQVTPAATTLKMLKNAIRIDPRSGLAHLYAGKVATVLGNKSEAGTFLNRAAMLMPRDMRVVEALKALR